MSNQTVIKEMMACDQLLAFKLNEKIIVSKKAKRNEKKSMTWYSKTIEINKKTVMFHKIVCDFMKDDKKQMKIFEFTSPSGDFQKFADDFIETSNYL